MNKLISLISLLLLMTGIASAQSRTQDKYEPDWVEVNSIELPRDIQIEEGFTRNGSKKYWIEIEEIKIYITSSNCEKYKAGEIDLLIVEWYNKYKDVYRYTTRAKVRSEPMRLSLFLTE